MKKVVFCVYVWKMGSLVAFVECVIYVTYLFVFFF